MAAITAYADLYPLIVPELPGCPEPVILQALKKTFRKFCQDTDAWREQLASIDLTEEQLNYDLASAFEADIRHIVEVRINTEEGIEEGNVGALIKPSLYTYFPEDTIRLETTYDAGTLLLDDSLEPAEDVTDGLEVKVSIIPGINADEIDFTFLTHWSDAVIGGTIWWLMTMKDRKWSDPNRAPLFMLDYNRGVSRARGETVGGHKVDTEDLSA